MLKKVFAVFCVLVCANASNADYSMSLSGGMFYGPGRMPDVQMPDGYIAVIRLKQDLTGTTPFFNNGGKPPNIRSGAGSEIWSLGLLSDGIKFNEHMDGGIINVGDGALKLLSVVTRDGDLDGTQTYRLDKECIWQISTDLALDPGFAAGIIFAKGLTITTGLIVTPQSLQSAVKIPGGIDSAGSLPSGAPVLGRLGDYDFDGKLDGTLVGAANIPLDHIFYPGAAVVQSRNFTTDIAIAPMDAAILELLGMDGYRKIFERIHQQNSESPAVAEYLRNNITFYLRDIRLRLRAVAHQLTNADTDKTGSERKLDAEALAHMADGLLARVEAPTASNIDAALNGSRSLLEKIADLAKQMRPLLSYNCAN